MRGEALCSDAQAPPRRSLKEFSIPEDPEDQVPLPLCTCGLVELRNSTGRGGFKKVLVELVLGGGTQNYFENRRF